MQGLGANQGVSPWLQSRSVQHVLQRADVDALGADLARLRAQLAARRPSAAAGGGGSVSAAGAGSISRGAAAAALGRTPLQQQQQQRQRPLAAAAAAGSSWRSAGGAEGGVSPITSAAARPLAALLHSNSSSSSTPVVGAAAAAAAAGSASTPGAYQTWPTLVGAGNRSSSSLHSGAAAGTPITPMASSSSYSWAGGAATADAPRQRPLQGSSRRAEAHIHANGVTVNRQAARQFDQHMRQLHSATANMRAHSGARDIGAAAGLSGIAGSPPSAYALSSSSMSNPGYDGAFVPAAAAGGSSSRWAGAGAAPPAIGSTAGEPSRSKQLQVLASHLELDAEHMRAEAAQQQADAVLQRDAMRDRRPPSPTLLEKWAREGSPTRHRRQQEHRQAAAAGASANAVASALYSSGGSSSNAVLGLGRTGLESMGTYSAMAAPAGGPSLAGPSLSPWRPLADEPQVLSVERVQETLSSVLQLQAATATAARQGPVQVAGGGRASPTALLRRQQAGLAVL